MILVTIYCATWCGVACCGVAAERVVCNDNINGIIMETRRNGEFAGLALLLCGVWRWRL